MNYIGDDDSFVAPEMKMGHAIQDMKVDIWSMACLFAGMIFGMHNISDNLPRVLP